MKIYYSLLSAIAILFLCSTSALAVESPLPSPQATRPAQKLADFNTISVRGPIHLTLEQTADGSQNFFQFLDKPGGPVSFSVKNGTLYVEAEANNSPTTAKVGVAQLTQLMVDGNASVTSKNLSTSSLSLDANTSGNIELSGMVNIDRILSSGTGLINIQWVDSSRLRIDGSSKSKIKLAGVAKTVEMRLRDESQFSGQYLRIDQIVVQTKDYSTAKLLVNDSLRAFAYDHSNIYYYKKPAELTEFTSDSGNILQLGWGQ